MLGGMSWIHWVIVIAVVALLFGGRGKLSGLMGDAAKGIRAFRDGLKGEDEITTTDKTGAALPRTESTQKEEAKS
ncbi:MAG: twin-arginine translocase TatA/TatE family subunit [Caulobacter sp.]|nr:twin-arginine translocase TatA/TatE family subunit [Caulobacter sp.]